MPKSKTIGKKELKKFINENGFFYSMTIDVKKNAPAASVAKIPEGASYFEGVVSNGELNRNGYIIRPQALMDSLADFMMNPVILLQHDTDEPIGHCLSAEARGTGATQEIFVTGYVYDDLTEGRFARGLFSGLSTGHIPLEVEFENSKTGEVISQEDFRKFNWEEQMSGDWIMAVTKLEWVEFSLVAIGSVRKALITAKNSIQAFLKNNLSENSVRGIVQDKTKEDAVTPCDGCENCDCVDCSKCECTDCTCEGGVDGCGCASQKKMNDEAPETTEAKEDVQSNEVPKAPEDGEDSENAGETPAATTEEPVEKDGEGEEGESVEPKAEGNKIRISKVDRERLQNAADTLVKTLEATMADEEESTEEAKVEDEQKAEDKPAEEQTPVEPVAGVENEEVQKPEANSVAINQVAPEIKAALQSLVDLNFAQEKEIQTLKLQLSKAPVKKGLAITSQFNTPTEQPKQSASQALVEMLRNNGFAI